MVLALGDHPPARPQATLLIENQSSIGSVATDGLMHFRFSPKDAKTYTYTIQSNVLALNEETGALTSYRPPPEVAQYPSPQLPNWWTDDPSPELAEGPHIGARTVSQWHEDFLRDFATRLDRCARSNMRGVGVSRRYDLMLHEHPICLSSDQVLQ